MPRQGGQHFCYNLRDMLLLIPSTQLLLDAAIRKLPRLYLGLHSSLLCLSTTTSGRADAFQANAVMSSSKLLFPKLQANKRERCIHDRAITWIQRQELCFCAPKIHKTYSVYAGLPFPSSQYHTLFVQLKLETLAVELALKAGSGQHSRASGARHHWPRP